MEILLTAKELAAALKLTEQTIQRYVMRTEIPYRKKIFRAVRFRPSEINQWIDNGGLKASGETDGVAVGETEAVRRCRLRLRRNVRRRGW
ncbi:MAG: helix-turn-helix domain-containing protein [Treponema sp.]|jgi:predicted DNA-binding transcriptional regulator AlpA|nr:helix-turn-helix domain-containing protein [Treponema sp.]